MAHLTPILAGESKAAQLLDMKPADFAALVEAGHLPKPCKIGDFDRWDVDELRRIARGEAVGGIGGVKW